MSKITLFIPLLFALLVGCASKSSSMVSSDFDREQHSYIAVYDSEDASFLELQLQQIFESLGYKVIGEKEASKYPNQTLGVRYNVSGSFYESKIVVTLEDMTTDKTLCTIQGSAYDDFGNASEVAWKAVRGELISRLGSE